jgi:hypothetical protein
MYTVLVYDYINKCHLIYDTRPLSDDNLYKIIDLILKNIKDSFNSEEIHVSYINENECEVYVYKENISKGWIWNSYVPEKKLLYKLQPIGCLPASELIDFTENSCQTTQLEPEPEVKDKIDTSCSTTCNCKCTCNKKYIKPTNDHYILDDIPLELTQSTASIQSTSSNFSNSSNKSNKSDSSNFSMKDVTDVINNISTDFGRYSIEWGRSFQQELKDKLNLENYGLYKYKKE